MSRESGGNEEKCEFFFKRKNMYIFLYILIRKSNNLNGIHYLLIKSIGLIKSRKKGKI